MTSLHRRRGARAAGPAFGLAAIGALAALALAAPAFAAGNTPARVFVPPPPLMISPVPAVRLPAPDQSPAAVAERRVVAGHIVREIMAHSDQLKPVGDYFMTMVEAQMKLQAQSKGGDDVIIYERMKGWTQLFGAASWEELQTDEPKFERVLSRYLAHGYSMDELRAVDALCAGPVMDDFMRGLGIEAAAMSSHQHDPDLKLGPEAKRALARFKASPGGRMFIARGPQMIKDPAFKVMIIDVMAAWFPGALRRWGEKAEAAENARQDALDAADGIPPPPAATAH